jgi:hypothetical protein
VLRSTADRLRQQRAVRQIELDSGWWEDRDLTVIDRTWFRLDVRALIEDHGGGNCLHRFAVRSRLTTAAAWPLLAGLGTSALLRYAGVPWSIGAPLVTLVAVLFALGCVLSTSRLVVGTLQAVAAEFGTSPVPEHRRHQAAAARPVSPRTQPAGLTLTTRAITRDTGASGAFVGDTP